MKITLNDRVVILCNKIHCKNTADQQLRIRRVLCIEKRKIPTRKPTKPNRWLITMRIKKRLHYSVLHGNRRIKRDFGSWDRIELLLLCNRKRYITTFVEQIVWLLFCPIRWSSFNRRVWLLGARRIFVRSYGCVAGHSVVVQQQRSSTVTGGRWRQSYNLCAEKNDSQELLYSWFFLLFFCHETDACWTLHTFRAVLNKKDNAKQQRL